MSINKETITLASNPCQAKAFQMFIAVLSGRKWLTLNMVEKKITIWQLIGITPIISLLFAWLSDNLSLCQKTFL